MFKRKPYIPERPKEVIYQPANWIGIKAEYDRLYLEKCKEVNELEQRVEKFKRMAEIAVKQKHDIEVELNCKRSLISALTLEMEDMKQAALADDLISREAAIKEIQEAFEGFVIYPPYMQNYDVDYIKNQYNGKKAKALTAIRRIPAVSSSSTIRELAAEPLKGFYPDVELPEELPEELAESVPLWASQVVSSQDILCLSSALKNLYEIHKTDGWLLYNRLAKVLEQKIEEYCKEEG